MITRMLLFFYQRIPVRLRVYLGSKQILKPIRDLLLRPKDRFREAKVTVNRRYLDIPVGFYFYASVKVAAKAENRGIENTILRNSIKLFSHRILDSNLAIMDVGSNFGYLSLVWATTIAKNGSVRAFEPNSQVFQSFRKSIKANNFEGIIQPNNVAVGEANGYVNLYSSSSSSNTLDLSGKSDGKSSIKMVSLDMYIADNNIEKCDLVKIDVDGIEYAILKGAEELIKRFRPTFIVETNVDMKLIDFFENRNYKILDMKLEVYRREDEIPGNIFCIPNK